MRTVRINGQHFSVGIWECKNGQGSGCACCQPKAVIHPRALAHPALREYNRPVEISKSRAYIFHPRNLGQFDGSAKSKRKN